MPRPRWLTTARKEAPESLTARRRGDQSVTEQKIREEQETVSFFTLMSQTGKPELTTNHSGQPWDFMNLTGPASRHVRPVFRITQPQELQSTLSRLAELPPPYADSSSLICHNTELFPRFPPQIFMRRRGRAPQSWRYRNPRTRLSLAGRGRRTGPFRPGPAAEIPQTLS